MTSNANWARPLARTIDRVQINAARSRNWGRAYGERLDTDLSLVGKRTEKATFVPGRVQRGLRVCDVMSTTVVSVAADAPVQEIAAILVRHRISSVVVINAAGQLVGIISEGDLIRRAEIGTEPHRSWWRAFFANARASAHAYVRSHGRTARDVMSVDVVTAAPDEPLQKFAARMAGKRLRCVPVVQDGRTIGVIARSDLVRRLAAHSAQESRVSDDALRAEVTARIENFTLHSAVVNTDVNDGVVSLYGWAASPIETRALEVAIENTPGVLRVRNCLSRTLPYV